MDLNKIVDQKIAEKKDRMKFEICSKVPDLSGPKAGCEKCAYGSGEHADWCVAAGWTYKQSTGELSYDGKPVDTGYSGHGVGRNSPAHQADSCVGPIPCGDYLIGAAQNTKTHGPCVMTLTPAPLNYMFGRSGFLIHGDNKRHDASLGCIILGPSTRAAIDANRPRTRALRVIA